MGDFDKTSTPELAGPILPPLPVRVVPGFAIGIAVVASVACGLWMTSPTPRSASLVPAAPADLSEGFITPVDPGDRAAVAAAVATLRLPPAQRAQIERDVLEHSRRLAWIVLTDSLDPDGDSVTVEAGGIVQHVVLSNAWMPVAVPLAGPGVIGITGVRDGGGGGITVALATRAGSVALRTLLPGERIEVAAP